VQHQARALANSSLGFAFRREEITEVFETPLLDLVYKAATVHRMYNDPSMVSFDYAYRPDHVVLEWSRPVGPFGLCIVPTSQCEYFILLSKTIHTSRER
jgi:hypothetical protein